MNAGRKIFVTLSHAWLGTTFVFIYLIGFSS